jgi:hypothetical protein
MSDSYKAHAIALVLNIIAGLIVWLLVKNPLAAVGIFACLCAIAVLGLALWSYRALGFRRAVRVRTALPQLHRSLDLAERKVDYLGVVPMVHVPESELFDKLLYKAQRGCSFRFLVLDPDSRFAVERRNDGGAYTPEQIRHLLQRLLEVRVQLGDKRDHLMVRIYNEYPVWCLGIVDDHYSFLSFYGGGKPGIENPALLLHKGPSSFHEACVLQFAKLWERSRELQGTPVIPRESEESDTVAEQPAGGDAKDRAPQP